MNATPAKPLKLNSNVSFEKNGYTAYGYVHTLNATTARVKGGGYLDQVVPLSALTVIADPISS